MIDILEGVLSVYFGVAALVVIGGMAYVIWAWWLAGRGKK